MDEQSFLEFSDRLEYVASKLGSEPWITVYEYTKTEQEQVSYYSGLVRPGMVEQCLGDASWDLHIGHGMPGFVFYGDGRSEYLRFGDDNGVEPFIIDRDFHGLKPSYVEVSEEFRHFHNLYEDRRKGIFTALDDSGDDVEVIRMTPSKVQVRAKFLKEYLAARDMVMLLFFDFDRWSSKTLEELGMEKQSEDVQKKSHRYIRWVDVVPGMTDPARKTYARFMGKKMVKGSENYRPSMFSDRESRQYEEFIIGVDEEGDNVHFTCDEEKLANYFGKNPDAPHYLTPVFFDKAVMAKYYNDPAKYRVEDSNLHCGGYWGLRLDNNHRDYVVVYLGDLGKLAHKEQLYWKSFNVVPDGNVSDVAFRRSILGQWTDADEPALAFKASYRRFRDRWHKQFGWDLFKPLRPEDEHYWTTLHVPASENQKEFDDQVMALSKVLVERLNERAITKHITVEPNDKGITKFQKYLDVVEFPDRQALITLLRNLNDLRSGPAHVKGKTYERASRHFDLDEKGQSRAFSDLFVAATALINSLDAFMVPNED
ncbi:hypothetical protein [Actinomadura formosensis]|uniref:hypothetical protein n=1 Tax=Actinomadura formosensis TaxID=60706 RepID=UPI00082C1C0A|nr:hypothetical protein [Actinomadura formosensis]